MNTTPKTTAIHTGVIPCHAVVPNKLAEIKSLAQRLAMIALRAEHKRKMLRDGARFFDTKEELEKSVNRIPVTDEMLREHYDVEKMAQSYYQPPFHLKIKDSEILVIRSPFFTYAPSDKSSAQYANLCSTEAATMPCYALPATWLLNWRKMLYHAPSVTQETPRLAWTPSEEMLVKRY